MKKFVSVIALILMSVSLFTACGVGEYEKEFYNAYIDSAAYNTLEDAEIKEVAFYEDKNGGKLAEFSCLVESTKGLYVETEFYLVVSEIELRAKEIELAPYEEELYGTALLKYNGSKLSEGSFFESLDIFDSNFDWKEYTEEYDLLMTWKALQSDCNYDVEVDVDKINELISDYNKSK